MLDVLTGNSGGEAGTPVVYSANPSHTVAPLSVNSQAAVGNGANTGVGNTSGPVVQSGSTTGMTRATESDGLSLQQYVTQAVQAVSVKGISGNDLRNAIINNLSSAGLTSDQISSIQENSGIVGTNAFTQNATASQQQGWVNQILSAISIANVSSPPPTSDTDLPINNVVSDPTNNGSGDSTTTTPPATTTTTVGDPPADGGTTTTTTTTPIDTGTGTGTVPSDSDPWATILSDVLSGSGSGGASIGAGTPAPPETPLATSTTNGSTSGGGSNTLLLLGVLAAGGGGLWYFMHKKHKDAQAKTA